MSSPRKTYTHEECRGLFKKNSKLLKSLREEHEEQLFKQFENKFQRTLKKLTRRIEEGKPARPLIKIRMCSNQDSKWRLQGPRFCERVLYSWAREKCEEGWDLEVVNLNSSKEYFVHLKLNREDTSPEGH